MENRINLIIFLWPLWNKVCIGLQPIFGDHLRLMCPPSGAEDLVGLDNDQGAETSIYKKESRNWEECVSPEKSVIQVCVPKWAANAPRWMRAALRHHRPSWPCHTAPCTSSSSSAPAHAPRKRGRDDDRRTHSLHIWKKIFPLRKRSVVYNFDYILNRKQFLIIISKTPYFSSN